MIVGEMDLVRGALAAVLAHEDDLDLVSDLSLSDDVVGAAHHHQPAVVVVGPDRQGTAGLEAAMRLAGELPECRVLLLTRHQTPTVLRRALAAGVWGVVSPDTTPALLVQSVRRVAGGERVLEPRLAAAALRPATPLTRQEQAVLALAGEGLRSREIAQRLFLSAGTVRNYLSAVKRKTGARNRLEAYRRAREEGWL